MTTFRQNILANYAGRGWAGLMSLAFIPVYIQLMGIEAYGLVGFFMTLQVVVSLLDMGLSAALNRELARDSAAIGDAAVTRNLVRTLEIVYFAVAAGIALAVFLLAPLIARHWLSGSTLSVDTVRMAIMLMGLTLAFQWPSALYSGGLMGLQRQVLLNAITIVLATLRWGGSAIVLWLVEPTIHAFFIWQVIVSAAQTAITGIVLWQCLPAASGRARFAKTALLRIWRFAAGMTGISALAIVLTQLDKIILSKLLPLEMFGYYTLASVVASGLLLLVTPIFAAAFPNFSQLVAAGNANGLKERYHRVCQLVSVIVLPAALVLALFAEEILLLWTHDAVTTANAHPLLSLLVIGSALNGLMHPPYAMQLAHGWTRFAFVANVIAVVLLAPAIIWATMRYGAIGAAAVWAMLNSGYVLIGMPIMHRWLLRGELKEWYLVDIGFPLLTAMCVVIAARVTMPDGWGAIPKLAMLFLVWTCAVVLATVSAEALRKRLASAIPSNSRQKETSRHGRS